MLDYHEESNFLTDIRNLDHPDEIKPIIQLFDQKECTKIDHALFELYQLQLKISLLSSGRSYRLRFILIRTKMVMFIYDLLINI